MIDWHRLFGMVLTLHFADYPLTIELEKELAIKRQMLDVLIMRKGSDPITQPLPDGLEDLAQHNLITYKSIREPLDDWVLKELTGHYVNYRKVISPAFNKLLPEEQFCLIAVSTRFPQKLANQSRKNWKKLKEGVYQVKRGSDLFRVIVLKQIPNAKRNLVWQLFSAQQEKVQEAARHYAEADNEINTIINELFAKYQAEGIKMPYTLQDFRQEYARQALASLTLEERLAGLAPEERLLGLAPEEVFTQYEPEERLAGLAPEERLAGLSAKDRKWLAQLLLKEQDEESSASDKE